MIRESEIRRAAVGRRRARVALLIGVYLLLLSPFPVTAESRDQAILAGGDLSLGRRAMVTGDVHANQHVTLEKDSRIEGDLTWTGSLLVNRGTVTGTAQQAPKRLVPALPSEAEARAAADRVYEQSTDFTNAVIDDVVFVAGQARILGTIEGRGTLIAETIVVEPEEIFTSPPFPTSMQVTLVSYGDVIVGMGRWLRGTVLAGGSLSLDAASLTGSVTAHKAITLTSEANIVFESFDETPPVIADVSPADGSVVPVATVEIAAAWSDDESGIDLASAVLRVDDVDRTAEATVTADGVRLSPGSPWTEGAHAVHLSVADLAGNAATSSWSFVVDTVPPQLVFAEPTEPVVLDDPAPRIVLAGSDATSGLNPSTFELDLDGAAITHRCSFTTASATCHPPVLSEGEHTAAARVADFAGHTTTATLTFETRRDLAGPAVVITSPAEGDFVGSTEILVTGTVQDDSGVAAVRVNGQAADVLGDHFQATVTSSEGPVVLEVTAEDVTGKEGFAAVVVTVDTTSPTLTIEQPAEGALTNQPTARIAGRVTDSSPITSSTLDGDPLALDGSRFAADVALTPGSNTVAVEAVDAAGNVGRANVSMTYLRLPSIEIAQPPDLATLTTTTVRVEGTVDDPTAAVDVNGVTAVVLSDGRFAADGVPLVEGGNVLAATVRTMEGSVNTATVHVVRDLTAPNVEITTPPDGAVVTVDRLAVSGLVNDLVAGTVNAQEATVTVNGVATLVRNRNFLAADVPLVLGENLLTARAIDESGNVAESTIRVRRESAGPEATLRKVSGDLQEGVAQADLPAPLVVAVVSGEGVPLAGRTVVFEEESGGGRLAGDRRRVAVATDSQGQAATTWTLGRRAGVQRVRASAVGVMQTADFLALAGPRGPAVLVVDAGDQQLGTAGHRLPRPFIATVTDDGFNRLGGVPVELSVVKGGGTFAGASSVVVETDSDGRAVATLTLGPDEGNANNAVVARIVGLPESPEIAFTASGRAAGPAEETAITGVVLDNTSRPIEGVTVRVDDTTLWTTTDAAGQFRIEPAPVGDVFLIVDGSTTERPGVWASLEFRMTTIAGRRNDLGMPIFLLPLDVADGLFVDEVTGGTVTAPGVPGLTLEIEPGSVTFPGGSKSGVVSITTVHSDRVPMVPNFGQQPRLIVTIQPAGARFDPPAKITYPNVEGLAPGESTDLYSFDHDLGHFVSIGPGTVSDDGTVLVSDPGVGILKAGWHCGGDPQPATGAAHDCPECQSCSGTTCVADDSLTCDDDDECTTNDACAGGQCEGDPVEVTEIQGPCTVAHGDTAEFLAVSNHPEAVRWECPAGDPASGRGATFTTRLPVHGLFATVRAGCSPHRKVKEVHLRPSCEHFEPDLDLDVVEVQPDSNFLAGEVRAYLVPKVDYESCARDGAHCFVASTTTFRLETYVADEIPGKTEISSASDPELTESSCAEILIDLAPASATEPPPRQAYWSRRATTVHEETHIQDFEARVARRSLEDLSSILRDYCTDCPEALPYGEIQEALSVLLGTNLGMYNQDREDVAHQASNAIYLELLAEIRDRAVDEGWENCQ